MFFNKFLKTKTDSELIPPLRLSKQQGPPPSGGNKTAPHSGEGP